MINKLAVHIGKRTIPVTSRVDALTSTWTFQTIGSLKTCQMFWNPAS